MENEKVGISDSKQALIGLNELMVFMIGRVKDGVGVDDVTALVNALVVDGEFKAKMGDAVAGIKNVPAELKDLDIQEGIELAGVQMSYLPKIVAALK